MINRRNATVALTLLPGLMAASRAETWPARPVRVILPYPPGGATDRLARIYANAMTEQLSQPVIVDNRPGATGTLGTSVALTAPPDGHTLLIGFLGSIVLMPLLTKNLPFKSQDIAPVARLATYDFVLVVRSDSRIKTLPDAIAAGTKTKEAGYATTGVGSPAHLVMEDLKRRTGARLSHIPYKGEQPILQDLLGGHVDMAFITLTVAEPLLESGKIKALGVASPQRAVRWPQIPTFAELGFPDASFNAWAGIFMRKEVPTAIGNRVAQATQAALAQSATNTQLRDAGFAAAFEPGERFAASISAETQRYAALIEGAGITAE